MENKLRYVILFLLNSLLIFAQGNYYPREGEYNSRFYDGPYLYYKNSSTLLIKTLETSGKTALKVAELQNEKPKNVQVFKSGFMPVQFNADIKDYHENDKAVFKNVDKLFVLSDIEGNFNTFVNLLSQHEVLNSELKWIFGNGHLVIIGDVFDRGVHQTELLWLIYKLEKEAEQAGGYVHFLLGNHEVMNLQGDLRYLEQKYIELDSLVSAELNLSYTDLIGPDSELGKWLRSKNCIVKIDDKIFVHAGISPKLMQSGLTIDEINENVRKRIDKEKDSYDMIDSLLFKRNGPLWYRGYFNEEGYETASQKDVDKILEKYRSEYIFVGHSRVKKPEALFNGHIIAINVDPIQDHLYSLPARKCYGVLIENNAFFIADENGYIEEF